MTSTIRGIENSFCPHCDWKIKEVAEVTVALDGLPDLHGWAWRCKKCGAQGPVVPTEAEALSSLLTRDGQQLKHFRALMDALRTHDPDLVEDKMAELDLRECECGDLCPWDDIYIAEDGDMCPLCLADAVREAREEGEQLNKKGLFRCRECEKDIPRAQAVEAIDEYGRSLCPDCKAQIRACRVCGCTDDDCSQCVEAQGHPCHWVEHDLCSRCAPAEHKRGPRW